MTLFNYIFDNEIVFFSLYTGMAGFMAYKIASVISRPYYSSDKGTQTDAWENYSPGVSNRTVPDSVTSLDTVTPI